MIKIAIVAGSLNMGGAELITLNLASGLKKIGYDVTVMTVTEPGEWFHLLNERGILAIHIPGRQNVHPYRHAWRVGKRLRDEAFRVVILVKYTNSERCTQAALNMLSDDVIVIPWIHNDTMETYKTALTNITAWNAAVGVGVKVTETAKSKSKGKPVIHIPNGIESPPPELLQTGRTAHDRPFRLCYLGRMDKVQKGIFNLPAILELCVQKEFDVILDLVGDGPDKEELVRRFNERGLMNHVEFYGSVSHDEIFKFLYCAHAVLMPSYYEAMPCVPIEAQFCGCVPIVSNFPGVTDTIVKNGQTGMLVPVDDINGFVQAIGKLINDPVRWQTMSQAGPPSVSKYTVDAMVRRFDQLIQACLHGEYPLQHPRRSWLPVNPLALSLREAIPRQLRRMGGVSTFFRKVCAKLILCLKRD